MKTVFILLATSGLALSAQAGCYSVYNPDGRLLHQSRDAPVDTRQTYHQTVPLRFGPGAVLVYVNDDQRCPELLTQATQGRQPGNDTGQAAGMARQVQGRPGRADRG